MTYGVDTDANALLISLLAGKSFTIPDFDLTGPEYEIPDLGTLPEPSQITNGSLTTGVIGGDGTFDKLMAVIDVHLQREFEQGRISGAEYTKAYTAAIANALGNAVQFLLGRDAAYWQAVTAQLAAKAQAIQLVTTRVQLEIAKAQLAEVSYQALNQEAVYALTKAKLGTEDMAFGVAKFNLDFLMPQQLKMLTEQTEAQRAQTMDTRLNGVTPVAGVMGQQRALYAQQIVSYKRDAEVKAAKIFTDAWITMKTIDEGVLPPNGFINASIDLVLTKLKTENGFTGP